MPKVTLQLVKNMLLTKIVNDVIVVVSQGKLRNKQQARYIFKLLYVVNRSYY